MNRDTIKNSLTTSIFLGSILAIMLPLAFFTLAAGSDTFTASATIANQAPTISVSAGQAWTGSAGTTAERWFYFNATDTNGESDLNASTAAGAINQSGTVIVAACGYDSNINANTNQYRCNFTLAYYHTDGAWSIEANISDNSWQNATDATQTGTVNTLDGVSVVDGSISFSGNPGATVGATENAQELNNTGNQDYTSINITGYSFTSGANVLDVGNVTVNVSDGGGNGQSLVNATEVLITSAALNHGEDSRESLWFYLDIPSGQANGAYSAQAAWTLEANQ